MRKPLPHGSAGCFRSRKPSAWSSATEASPSAGVGVARFGMPRGLAVRVQVGWRLLSHRGLRNIMGRAMQVIDAPKAHPDAAVLSLDDARLGVSGNSIISSRWRRCWQFAALVVTA
jgi:hypothetical protein